MPADKPKPRITLALSNDGEFFEIYMNEEGRRLLIEELSQLDEKHEHLHLSPDEFGDLRTSDNPYRDGEKVVPYGKIYLRLDEWDRQYFPHLFSE